MLMVIMSYYVILKVTVKQFAWKHSHEYYNFYSQKSVLNLVLCSIIKPYCIYDGVGFYNIQENEIKFTYVGVG